MLAVPALGDETIGRQLGRALACGTPVLASDLPRLRGLVQHGETGLLIPAGSVDAWTEAVRQGASSPVARKRWSANGRAFAEANLAWPMVATRFEDTFLAARERVQAKLGALDGVGRAHPNGA